MRVRGFIVVAAVAGLVHVYAEYSLRSLLAALAGAVALAALAFHAYTTGRPWPVTAVPAALSVAVLLPVFWYERTGPMSQVLIDPRRLNEELRLGMLRSLEITLVRYRWIGLAMLAAAVLLALAARNWQADRQRSRLIVIVTSAIAVVMVGVGVYTLPNLGDAFVWVWPALLAAIVFLAAAAYSGEAIGAFGGTLLGIWALGFADLTARQASALSLYDNDGGAFLEPGLRYSVALEFWPTDPWAAAYGVIMLVGVGLLAVVGPLRQQAVDRVAA